MCSGWETTEQLFCVLRKRFKQNSSFCHHRYQDEFAAEDLWGKKASHLHSSWQILDYVLKSLVYLTFRHLTYQNNWFILIMIQFFMNFLMELFIWSTRAFIINRNCCKIEFYRGCMKLSVGKAEELRLWGFLGSQSFSFSLLLLCSVFPSGMQQECLTLFLLQVFLFNIFKLLKAAVTNPSFPPSLCIFCSTPICALLSSLWCLSLSPMIF